jgi:hypothetical protein
MDNPSDTIALELLTWISQRARTYAETMEAWQTSCPRYSVWEDALSGGLIQMESGETGKDLIVILTPLGKALIRSMKVA